MGRLTSEWRWVGNGEHSSGLPQTEKLSRKNTDRSLWRRGVHQGRQAEAWIVSL